MACVDNEIPLSSSRRRRTEEYQCHCGARYTNRTDLEQHKSINCQIRSLLCSFCQEPHSSTESLRKHLISCGNKTDQCPKCLQYIRRAIFTYHYENNCAHFNEIDFSTRINEHDNGYHSSKLSDKKNTKDYQSLKSNQTQDYSTTNKSSSYQNLVRIPCEFCDEPIDLPNWSIHTKECREREYRRLETRAQTINQESVNERVACEYCEELISIEQLQKHEMRCLKNPMVKVRESKSTNLRSTPAVSLRKTSLKADKSSVLPSGYSSLRPSAYDLPHSPHDPISNRHRHSASHMEHLSLTTSLENRQTMKSSDNDPSSHPNSTRPLLKPRRESQENGLQLINSSQHICAYDSPINPPMRHHLSVTQSLPYRSRIASFDKSHVEDRSLPRRAESPSISSSRSGSASRDSRNHRGGLSRMNSNAKKPLPRGDTIDFHNAPVDDQTNEPVIKVTNRPRSKKPQQTSFWNPKPWNK